MAKKKSKPEKGSYCEVIGEIDLLDFAREHYSRYGRSVLEDRAFPDFRDGMNPVNRRTLWSAYSLGIRSNSKFVKSARIVGDVLGRYHPHGDASVYGAMVKMTNVNGVVSNIPIGLFEGEGNWGSLSNSAAAAMRYTEARLSKFSDEVLFNKFYMPVVRMIPNFDSSTVEPLILPALLPLVLLNGRFGIAPGATTNIPKLEPDGVFDVLRAAFKGEELTPKFLAKTLRLTSTFGGAEDESRENMRSESRREIFTSVRGSTNIVSPYEYDEKKRTMVFDGFAVDSIPPVIAKLIEIKAVQTARDISDVKDRFGRLEVQFKRLDEDQIDTAIGKVLKILSSRENVVLNFTVRTVNDLEQSDASMRPMTLIEVFTKWVKWRLALEVKACKYWVKEDDKEIRRIELLKQAVLMLDFIVGLLKNKKLTQADVYQMYAKKAKIEIEEAKYVLNRPIISLRNLEVIELDAKIRELRQHRSELVKRGKNPSKFALSQLKHLRTLVYSLN